MSNAPIIDKWDSEATTRTHNAALSTCSPLNSARLKNLFASADVADAIEYYTEDTDAELFEFAKEGDDLAAWALFVRNLPQTEMLARRNGSLNVVVDEDDVFQMIAEAFLLRLQSEDTYEVFRSRFLSDSRHTLREAQRFSTAFTAPSQELAYVRRLVREFEGDMEAAYEAAVENSDAAHRMSRDRFYSLAGVLDPRQEVRLDEEVEGGRSAQDTIDDPSAARAFASVLGATFESDDVEDAWAGLTDREREIVDRRLGITSGVAETAVEIAASLGITKQAVSKSYTNAINKVRGAISPRRNTAQVEAPAPKRRVRKAEVAPVKEFPVTVRTVDEEVPEVSAAERRANPRDGIGYPMRIRMGDQWDTIYRQPVPDRVHFGVFRSSAELNR